MHVILIDTSDKEKKKRKPQMEISIFLFEESLFTIGRISMCVLSVYLLMCLYKVSMLIVSHCVVKTTRVKLVECFLSAELLQLRIPQRLPNVAAIWKDRHTKQD